MLKVEQSNARGLPVNESNRLCVHSEQKVERARAFHTQGATYQQAADPVGVPSSTAWRWCKGKTRNPSVSLRVARTKTSETPRHCSGPARFAWVNTFLCTGGLPRSLNDHYFLSTICPPDVWRIECELASMPASPYEVRLVYQATNGLASLQFNLIPK